jgi:hypothetical protein
MRLRNRFAAAWGIAAAGTLGVGVLPAAATTPGSTTFGGYQGTLPAAATTTIKASIKVPSITCGGQLQTGISMELMANGSSSQLSTSEDATLNLLCSGGNPEYQASVSFSSFTPTTFENDSKGLIVSPGDVVHFTIVIGSTSVETVKDSTVGRSASIKSGPSVASSLHVGDTYFGSSIPTFTSARFTGVSINSSPLSSIAPTATNLVDSGGQVMIATGALSSTGTAFSLIFKNNS